MIYNDVRVCSVSSPKRSPTFCMRNLDFEEQICYAQHSSLLSYINNCDYACTWMDSLKGKRSDSETKLKALFFSYRKPGFWIHKLVLGCKLQIFHHYFSFSDIDDCDPLPCENGATCHDGVNNYTCTCMASYEGYNCSMGKLDHFPSYSTYYKRRKLYCRELNILSCL